MKEALKVINVSKSFGSKKVIKDINFTVRSGEIVGFLGPNGAGKSVTMKMIVGFLYPDKGEILINGCSITKNYEAAMEYIGAIVENPDLYEYLSGYDNIKLIARVYNKDNNKIKEIVKLIGLQNSIHEKVKNYSLGMKQRLGLGLALIRDPKLLILDEPTNGLDPEGIHELRNIIRKLACDKSIAVLISSHLLSEIELICDSVIVINKGQVIKEDSIENIKRYNFNKIENGYYLETDNTKKALEIIEKEGITVSVDNNQCIRFDLPKEKVTSLLNVLIGNGLQIFEIAKQKNTLEDIFLNMTEGGDING